MAWMLGLFVKLPLKKGTIQPLQLATDFSDADFDYELHDDVVEIVLDSWDEIVERTFKAREKRGYQLDTIPYKVFYTIVVRGFEKQKLKGSVDVRDYWDWI